MFNDFDAKIKQLTNELDPRKSLDIAIETANEFLKILDPTARDLKISEDALDEAIPANKFPNHKVENWFANHPYFTGDKVALQFYSSDMVETKFYWLSDSATKARVSAGVMLTPNWEDLELNRNDSYKVGIDFFLTSNAKSLLVVVSNNGNLRLLEFSEKLSHTQIEILQKLRGSLGLSTKEQIHKTLWDALALSEVNKKFYAGIAEQFNILLNHLTADGKDKEDSKLFASRLLGRILFIWFLRRKNIIQEQFGYFELDGNDSTKYYDSKLKKLFFATLNKPIGERQGEDDKTPYLNGGLFEAHDNDWAHKTVEFPTGFFNGLYEHLEKYNFTTDESSPEYEQVAIDPEMLGRVFESLLATQITDTGDQARKAKGAFYTPREIVGYMCKESLRHYLYIELDSEILNEGVDKLLDATDSEWVINHSNSIRNLWGEANRNTVPLQVIGALNKLKILDPACGSGAFPMGMLQLILKTYERLDSTYDPYKKKLQIIQENIYGVDIEPMAVEISRLRAWLSLVVDEEDGRDIEPLPNLDFKFVCANSLLPLEQQRGLFADVNLHEKLAEVRAKFFNARKPEMKEKWKKEYKKLTGNGQATIDGDVRDTQLKSFDPFMNSQNAEFFDADYMFGVPKFDIVIGNPPYGAKYPTKHKAIFQKIYGSAKTKDGVKGSLDTYSLFIDLGLFHNIETGVLCYIVPLAFTSSDGMMALHDMLLKTCSLIQVSTYSNRPKKIFDNADQRVSIVLALKDNHPTERILTTGVLKRYASTSVREIIDNLNFVNSINHRLRGRFAKVNQSIELDILDKIFSHNTTSVDKITSQAGGKVWYRSAGGRYFNVVTNYANGLSSEKYITVDPKLVNPVCAILSSSLFWWYQQAFTDGLNLKAYEIGSFPIPSTLLDDEVVQRDLDSLYLVYAEDIERNVTVRETGTYKHITSFKEYKLRKSMSLIDKIDKVVNALYGLSDAESKFISGYDRQFRVDDETDSEE